MTASISLPLAASWSDNATCSVHNRFERARGPGTDVHATESTQFYFLITFFMSTILKSRWPETLSKRSREALFRLDRFRELKPNWDSYNATVPTEASLNNAERFIIRLDRKDIPPYFVSPGPNGDVLVQYKCDNGHEAEIWFEKDGSSDMLLITPGKPPYEAPLDMEFLLEHLRTAAKR